MTILYTARVQVRGGRDGSMRSDDGLLEARLAVPVPMGGDGKGTNPEQLFAAGYAACFASTLAAIAKASGHSLTDVTIAAEVDVGVENGAYDLAIRLVVSGAGVDRATLEPLIERAKSACPYSRATRNNLACAVSVGG